MLRVYGLGDSLVDYRITRYVNDNLGVIIVALRDAIEDSDDKSVESILPKIHMRKDREPWTELVSDLYEMVWSDVLRDCIKPKYEFLLYEILEWWEDINFEGELIPVEMDEELVEMVLDEYMDDADECVMLDMVTDYQYYYDFLFRDYDFRLSSVERFVTIYLRSPQNFRKHFPDVDLELYRNLMPRDLREQYDELRNHEKDVLSLKLDDRLFEDVLYCCERIQANAALKDLQENELNDSFRDLLEACAYTVRDQTRQGCSKSGKSAGEIDVLVKDGKLPLSIIEAMKATCVDENKISDHINRIYKYDTLGNRCNYLILYVHSKEFRVFWERFQKFIMRCTFAYCMKGCFENKLKQFPELRTMEVIFDRNGIETKLYCIAVHLIDETN